MIFKLVFLISLDIRVPGCTHLLNASVYLPLWQQPLFIPTLGLTKSRSSPGRAGTCDPSASAS